MPLWDCCCLPCPGPPGHQGFLLSVTCTPGFEAYLNSDITKTDTVRMENVFNDGDGPAPYTITSIEAAMLQQTIFEVELEDSPGDSKKFTGIIKPFIQVVYEDGSNATRSKFIYFTIPVESNFFVPDGVDDFDLKFYSFLLEADLQDVNLSSNTLTFSYEFTIKLLVTNKHTQNFAVINVCEDAKLPDYLPIKKVEFVPV